MVVSAIGRLGLILSLGLALTGCENGKGPAALFGPAANSSADGAAPAASEAALTVVERDVEAPNVFDLTDEGLWDGRPSLGGVWVAHSSVTDPERVIIRNPANGKSVVGALFRREAANPGPSLQVSSDAADALGMLAGSPASLEVVALRRQGLPEATPADETEFPAAPTEPVIADAAADGGEAAAVGIDTVAATAAAAIDEAEGIAPTADAAVETGADGPADASATDIAVAGVAAEKKCPFWRKKKCEAERAAATMAGTVTGETATGEPAATADGTAVAAADPQSDVIAATPIAAGTLTRAYVQIGIFSVEENAQRAADQMKAAGMTATVKSDQSQGKTFWRVIVGPAASVAERDALAARVKGIGYPDAYPVSK